MNREHYRIPKGCDYQGRWPEAAEAATEIGAEEDHDQHAGFGAWVVPVLMVFCCLAAVLIVHSVVRWF